MIRFSDLRPVLTLFFQAREKMLAAVRIADGLVVALAQGRTLTVATHDQALAANSGRAAE